MSKRPNPTEIMKKVSKALHAKKPNFPNFRVGDVIRVFVKVKEGEKTRVQAYEGLVIRKRRGGDSASFTVRKISYGVGVERIFPFNSPVIDKITLVSNGEVRRAKLYYLRELSGRASRIKSDLVFGEAAEAPQLDSPAGGAEEGDSTPDIKAVQA